MEFLIGLGSLMLLIPFFLLVVFLMDLLPPEFSLGAVLLMFVGDGAIAGTWYLILEDFVQSESLLRMGLAMSFLILTVFKVCYMVLNPKMRKLMKV
jgi:hypothetical protein